MTYETVNLAEQDRTPERTESFNHDVLVKITPYGEAIWNKSELDIQWRVSQISAEGTKPYQVRTIERDAEGYTRLQLWEVAYVFGPHMFRFSPDQMPVEMTFKFPEK